MLLLWSKLPTYFDDITTMENSRQVHLKIDATLAAIFRIVRGGGGKNQKKL